ncbi:MAG TPA: twin-arginine translocation signal domain-containing protein [Tepidisphaeraceae bacterium]|jgi:hypothetical protein|nr:twin-arginine translocation signal domain-containing protein [Tepidisphaeraceae bacterium]
MNDLSLSRRDILKTAAAVAAGTVAASIVNAQPTPAPQPSTKPSPTIGIQTGPAPLASKDFDRTCDELRQRAGVNAIFPFIYTYAPSTAAMKAAGFRGGNFATPHMEYYKNTPLTYQDMRAPEFGDMDVFAHAIPIAKKHGTKMFAWIIEDHGHAPSAAWEPLYEVDFHGRRALSHPAGPCFNNPQYRGFIMGLVEDYTRSYDIDGVMWGSERQGGFFNALGAYAHGSFAKPGQATCFCEFCQKKAKDLGIDVDRAKKGFIALEQYVLNGRAGKRPRDGFFVQFFRLLMEYPELLAWENLWILSRENLQAEMYRLVKSIKPQLPVGWHVWHNVSFSPLHRAETDYTRMAPFSDFLKPVVYTNCGGERIRTFADSVSQNIFGDMPPAQTLDTLYHMLDYQEANYDKVVGVGFSPDYVRRETQRAVDDVAGHPTEIWSGVGLDVPVPAGTNQSTPEDVKQCVIAAFKGGAKGLIISRNYPEMKPENLSGVGAALDELGLR